MQIDLEPAATILHAHDPHLGGQGLGTIVEHDAGAPSLDDGFGDFPFELDEIAFGDLAAGVQESRGELAVVGQEQRAAGLEVEASDRVEACLDARDEVGDGGAPLGVAGRGDDRAGLVHDDVDRCLGDRATTVDLDLVFEWVGACAELGDDLAVDPDTPGEQELLRVATRGDAGSGEDFL